MITEFREITDEDLGNLPLETWCNEEIETAVYAHGGRVSYINKCSTLGTCNIDTFKHCNKIKVEKPLTVEWIKENCVVDKTVFVDKDGRERKYVGVCSGELVVHRKDLGIFTWQNYEIKNWKVKK